jgi:hypothetical protein
MIEIFTIESTTILVYEKAVSGVQYVSITSHSS